MIAYKKKLFLVEQILLVGVIGNEWHTVRRICILILGCKRLIQAETQPLVLDFYLNF